MFYFVPLYSHMYEVFPQISSNSVATVLSFLYKWLGNGLATIPCAAFGQVFSTAFLVEIILIIVGVSSKKRETKCKMTKAVMVVMLIKIIVSYICILGEFLLGMLFLIFPAMNDMVTYQHWPVLNSITALVMFFGAAVVTGVYLVLKFVKK